MRQRKSILVAFLLVAVMCIGIGYAAVSTVLNITGTANISHNQAEDAFGTEIYFSSVTKTDGDKATDIHTTLTEGGDKITFSVDSLKSVGDTRTFTATIANSGTLDATIKVTTSQVNVGADYFEITTDWGTETKNLGKAVNDTTPTTITITVTVRLKAAPTGAVSGDFTMILTATSVDA